jgi:hypothetical protein
VLVAHRTLMRTQQPPLQQRNHPVLARQQVAR